MGTGADTPGPPATRRDNRRALRSGRATTRAAAWSAVVVALLTGVLLALGLVGAAFTGASASPASQFGAGTVSGQEPVSATATRTAATACQVSWTPRPGTPPGTTYDVLDASAAMLATAVPGPSATVTVPAGAAVVSVRARLSNWVSPASTAATCVGYPSAPTGLVLTPGEAQIAVSWTAAAGNGGTVTSSSVTASPGGAACTATAPATSCTLTGLTNGTQYTVSVTSTSAVGTGPAATGTTIPYPASVMSPARLALWLDAADASTLFSGSCGGAVATTSVGCWRDKSPSANDVSQPSASSRPGTATVNGRSVPSFDGTDDVLAGGVTGLPTGTATGTFAVAGAVDPSIAMNGVAAFSYGGTTNGSQRRMTSWVQAGVDVAGTPTAFASAWPAAQAQGVVVGEFTAGTGLSVWSGGDGGATATGAFSTGSDHLWVGAGGLATPSGRWKGTLPEVIGFTGSLSSAERRSVEEYLARKWGGGLRPTAPSALAAVPGDASAALTWTAPAASGTSAVTSSTATAVPSDAGLPTRTCTAAGTATTCTVAALTNGVTYTITVSATNATGSGAGSGAVTVIPVPALLTTSNAQLWLDGRDPDGDRVVEGAGESCAPGTGCGAAGNVLTRWEDKSGRDHDAVQASTPMAGSYAPGAGTVSFTGNGYYQAASVGVGPDATVFAAASSPTATWNSWGVLASGRDPDGWVLHPDVGSTGTRFFGITSAGYNMQTANTPSVSPVGALTAPHIWDGSVSGASTQTVAVAVDGARALTASSTGTRTARALTVTLGADDFDLAARRGQITFREVVALDRALTTAERRVVQEYLARKWGVPIAPAAPATVTMTPSDSAATAAWTAPSWNGGSAVTGYTVTATPTTAGFATRTCSTAGTLTCALSGLTNGVTYAVTVSATNAYGTGPDTTSTAVPFPSAVMSGAGLKVWLDGADASTVLASSTCSGPAATTTVGCWKDKSASANNATASGAAMPSLSTVAGRGVPTFNGSSNYMALTVAKLPLAATTSTTFVASTATTLGYSNLFSWGSITAGRARAFYLYDATGLVISDTYLAGPVSTNGSTTAGTPLLAYSGFTGTSSATAVNGRTPNPVTGAVSTTATFALMGGVPGMAYYWNGPIKEVVVLSTTPTAAERRSVEEYLARKWATTITPNPPSAAPTAVAGTNQATVSWSAPTGWDGGAAVSGYTVTASPGGGTCTATAPTTSCTVTGLAPSTAYTFTVAATNSAGSGPASAASTSVTTHSPPGAPTGVTATPGGTTAAVSWTAPASTGGAPITGFTATATPTDGTLPTRTCTGGAAATTCTVTGLTDGATYTVTVTATNGAGTGPASSGATVVPYPTTLFAPADLRVWLDAQHGASLSAASDCSGSGAAAGSAVGCWKDRSGNGWNAPRMSAAGATLTAAALNGRAALRFSKSAPNIYRVSAAGVGAVGSADRSVFAVVAPRTVVGTLSTQSAGMVAGWTGWNTGLLAHAWGGTTTIDTLQGDFYTSGYAAGYPSVTVAGGSVASGVWSSSGGTLTGRVAVNGGTAGTASVAGSWLTAPDSFVMGGTDPDAAADYAYPLDGDVGEVLVFDRALSPAEQRTVEEYLARRWGLTLAP